MATKLVTYHGNCHCAAFKFTVQLPELKNAAVCDCSICLKKGYLRVSVMESNVKVLRGEGELVGYQFAGKVVKHEFCKVCGTPVWIRLYNEGSDDVIMLNVRTLLGVDVFKLEVEKLYGKSLEPAYVPPTFKGTLPEVVDDTSGLKVYTGSCHCGNVTLAVKSTPLNLPVTEILEDNCSICVRNANTLIYPPKTHVVISGTEHMREYDFGSKMARHGFCTTCGTQVYIKLCAPAKEAWDSFSEEVKAILSVKMDQVPLRVRILDGVDLEELKIEKKDMGTEGYVVT